MKQILTVPEEYKDLRLDVYLANAMPQVPSRVFIKKMVDAGHVKVNGKKVNIASYQVKVGDLIEVKEASRQLAVVMEAVTLAERDVPDYFEVDHGKFTAKMTRIPGPSDVPYPVAMEPNLVVEFYSR